MKRDKKIIILIVIVSILILVDQGLKLYSFINFNEAIKPNGIMVYEKSNSTNLINDIITNILVLVIIFKFFINQKNKININLLVVMSFLIAGGVSNLIDKLFKGNIINCIKLYNLPSINLSFVFIVIGWIGLAAIFAWDTFKEVKKIK